MESGDCELSWSGERKEIHGEWRLRVVMEWRTKGDTWRVETASCLGGENERRYMESGDCELSWSGERKEIHGEWRLRVVLEGRTKGDTWRVETASCYRRENERRYMESGDSQLLRKGERKEIHGEWRQRVVTEGRTKGDTWRVETASCYGRENERRYMESGDCELLWKGERKEIHGEWRQRVVTEGRKKGDAWRVETVSCYGVETVSCHGGE